MPKKSAVQSKTLAPKKDPEQERLTKHTKPELLKMCKSLHIVCKQSMTKDQIISLIIDKKSSKDSVKSKKTATKKTKQESSESETSSESDAEKSDSSEKPVKASGKKASTSSSKKTKQESSSSEDEKSESSEKKPAKASGKKTSASSSKQAKQQSSSESSESEASESKSESEDSESEKSESEDSESEKSESEDSESEKSESEDSESEKSESAASESDSEKSESEKSESDKKPKKTLKKEDPKKAPKKMEMSGEEDEDDRPKKYNGITFVPFDKIHFIDKESKIVVNTDMQVVGMEKDKKIVPLDEKAKKFCEKKKLTIKTTFKKPVAAADVKKPPVAASKKAATKAENVELSEMAEEVVMEFLKKNHDIIKNSIQIKRYLHSLIGNPSPIKVVYEEEDSEKKVKTEPIPEAPISREELNKEFENFYEAEKEITLEQVEEEVLGNPMQTVEKDLAELTKNIVLTEDEVRKISLHDAKDASDDYVSEKTGLPLEKICHYRENRGLYKSKHPQFFKKSKVIFA